MSDRRRSNGRAIGLLVLLMLGIAMAAAPPAAAAELLSFPAGTTASIVNTGATRAVFTAVPADGVDPNTLTASVVSVARDGRQSAADFKAFTVVAKTLPDLVLTVTDGAALPAGTYTVVVKFQLAKSVQVTPFTLTRSASPLVAPGTLKIVQSPGFLFWGGDQRPVLSLSVGQDDALNGLTGVPAEPDVGTVSIGGLPVNVRPGAPVTLAYRLDDFPLGHSVRTVKLDSPELAAPTTVTFDVTRATWAGWIAVVVLIGLGLGYALRTGIAAALARLARRRRSLDLRDGIALQLAHSKDAALHKELDEILAELSAAEAAAGPSTKQLDDWESKVTTAGEKLVKDIEAAHATYEKAKPLDRIWVLPADVPPTVPAGMGKITTALATVESALKAVDAATATTELAAIEKEQVQVSDDLRDWLGATAVSIADLQQAVTPARTAGASGALNSRLGAALRAVTPAADSSLVMLLTLAHDASGPLDRVRQAAGRLKVEFTDVVTIPAVAAEVLDGPQQFDEFPADGSLAEMATALPGLYHAADHAVGQAVAQSDHETEVLAAVAVGDYPTVRDILSNRVPVLDGSEDGVELFAPPAEPVEQDVLGSAGQPVPVTPGVIWRSARERARLAARETQWQILQWVLLALVTIAVSLSLYAPSWIGDYKDVILVFSWAFAIDLSVATVTGLLGAPTPTTPSVTAGPATTPAVATG